MTVQPPPPPADVQRGPLECFNPLAKLLGPVPAIILLLVTRDLATPAIFLTVAVAVLLVGARFTRTMVMCVFIVLPVATLSIALGLSLWADPAKVSDTPAILSVGAWTLHEGAFTLGGATGLRFGAIIALTFIAGVSTTGPDLVRSLIQQLRMPYRIGYAALAAYRFVPRFKLEIDIIRTAHRVRGTSRRTRMLGPLTFAVPLLAGGIRHAERVALAMDARAFGAYPTRAERYVVRWRLRDWLFVGISWVVTAAILVTTHPFG